MKKITKTSIFISCFIFIIYISLYGDPAALYYSETHSRDWFLFFEYPQHECNIYKSAFATLWARKKSQNRNSRWKSNLGPPDIERRWVKWWTKGAVNNHRQTSVVLNSKYAHFSVLLYLMQLFDCNKQTDKFVNYFQATFFSNIISPDHTVNAMEVVSWTCIGYEFSFWYLSQALVLYYKFKCCITKITELLTFYHWRYQSQPSEL